MLKIAQVLSLVLLISLSATVSCIAQEEKPQTKKDLKNTISYNITNTLIFGGKAHVLCYERTLGKKRSFTVELGTFSMPELSILPSSIKTNSESSQSGYKFAVDYRFYPASENKYVAPRGVYFAPYFSYNYFNRTKSFDIDTSTTNVPIEVTVSTDFTLKTTTFGAELGYQFIFWRRLSIDLILIGPGLTSYSINAKLDTSLEPDKESELFEALNDALAEKIPGYSYVIEPKEFKTKGSANTTTIGFRYLIHLGFRF